MGKLNTPFQERPSRGDGSGLTWASKPMFWAGGLLLVAAVVIGFVPPELLDRLRVSVLSPARPASAVAALSPTPAPAATTTTSTPQPMPAVASDGDANRLASPASASAVAAAAPAQDAQPAARSEVSAPPSPGGSAAATAGPVAMGPGLLHLAATADSWIEVIDAKGQPVFSRIVRRDEAVAVDAAPPLRVRVGNASGTQVTFRGQALELGPYTRDNVARLELR